MPDLSSGELNDVVVWCKHSAAN